MTGTGALPLSSVLLLALWAVIFLGLAARTFKWE
jgi:hypothetical protein